MTFCAESILYWAATPVPNPPSNFRIYGLSHGFRTIPGHQQCAGCKAARNDG